jgi:hypothetical protein
MAVSSYIEASGGSTWTTRLSASNIAGHEPLQDRSGLPARLEYSRKGSENQFPGASAFPVTLPII